MKTLKNIVWVGTGRLGLPILEKVATAGNFNIKLLIRNKVSTYANLPGGLHSVHQVDYSDHKSLVEHLQAQDAVIVFTSFVPGNELDKKHIALVNAGVKYFIPSEWALDTAGKMGSTPDGHGPTLPTDEVLAPKRVSHNYLLCRAVEGKWKFCVIYPSVLFELSFDNGIFGFNFATHNAHLVDNGINPFPATTLETLSKVIVSLFKTPSLISNKLYHVADGVLAQKDVFHTVEKESGVPWARTSYSTKEARNDALANIQKGVYGPSEYANSLMTPFFGGLQVWRHLDNEKLNVQNGQVDVRAELVNLVQVQKYL